MTLIDEERAPAVREPRPPAAEPPATTPAPVGGVPPAVRSAGITLIALGAFSTFANGMFVLLALTGELDETLADAGYEAENTGLLATLSGLGAALGIVAIAAGILVLRHVRTGRTVGIVAASLMALGWFINLVSGMGNVFTFVLLAFAVSVIYRLARAGPAFEVRVSTGPAGPAPASPTATAAPHQTPGPPAGWYPDPSARHRVRYFDATWTRYVSDDGTVAEDPDM